VVATSANGRRHEWRTGPDRKPRAFEGAAYDPGLFAIHVALRATRPLRFV